MKKTVLLIALLVGFACLNKQEDTTPPTVTITFSTDDSVSEVVSITCMSSDNEGVEKVELWVDGVSTGVTDETEPYSLDWNTTTYDDGSHTIVVRSYDTSDNTTDSDQITLTVDNSSPYPQAVSITSITYTLTEMTISWNQSTDSDFDHYELLVSESEEGEKSLLLEITEQNNTTNVLNEFDPLQPRWYWVSVFDVYGYSTVGSWYYVLDDNPTQVELYPITYQDGSFTISWSQNNDYDFSSYKLYESTSEDMNNQNLIFETVEQTVDTYLVTDIGTDEIKYYQVFVEDIWELQSVSNIQYGSSYTLFVKTFGGSDYAVGYSVQKINDNGYIIVGVKDWRGCLIKTDINGNEEWNQVYELGTGGYSGQQTEDGGYIITGYTNSFGNGSNDVWLIKTDSEGNQEWNQTFGGSDNDYGNSVQQTSDGGYIITGSTDEYVNVNVWLIKTDSNGNEEWNQTFGGDGYDSNGDGYDNRGEEGHSVRQTVDGGYIIVANTFSFGNDQSDIWVIKTDSEGQEEWNSIFGGSDEDYGRDIQQTTDGGYVITGYSEFFGNGADVWLIKTDSNGNEEWNKTMGDGWYGQRGYSVQQTTDGGYVITGYGNGNWDFILIKTDSNGNEEWNKTFAGSNGDKGYSVQQTTDGGYIITGSTESFGDGTDIWLIKTDPHGNTVPESEWEN